MQTYPAQEWVLITDNLSPHRSRKTQVALLAWPEVTLLFIPKDASWLNLIEPWWKQSRSLALKGRRVERIDEVMEAILEATVYWNAHCSPQVWKKLPNVGKEPFRRNQIIFLDFDQNNHRVKESEVD